MPHQPGHDPAAEKAIVCCSAAKQHATGAVAAIETLSTPYPGGGHATLFDALFRTDPSFASFLAEKAQLLCELAEGVENLIGTAREEQLTSIITRI